MTNLILEAVNICDPHSTYHNQQKNISVENGVIRRISDEKITLENAKKIPAAHLTISPAWIDMQTFNGETGYEHKETLETLSLSAISGGFSKVMVLPNTQPVADKKSVISFLKNQSKLLPIEILPMATVSQNAQGKNISEMIDLFQAGALAFSDGLAETNNLKLLKNALHYLRHIHVPLIVIPDEVALSEHGQMHEGICSTRLGMKGIPNIAEKMAIQAALDVLEYTGGKLHLSKISTSEGVSLIRRAKAKGLDVSADTEAYRFAFTDEDLSTFDTNLKVKPPFRTSKDNRSVLDGVKDGTIDALISAHIPHDIESKRLEFNLADFGIIGLETVYASLRTYTHLSTPQIVKCLAINPAKILRMKPSTIQENVPADFTLFDENLTYRFTQEHIKSKSKNTPFLGKMLTGKVVGVFTKGKFTAME